MGRFTKASLVLLLPILSDALPSKRQSQTQPQLPIVGQYEPYNTARGPDNLPPPAGWKKAILPTAKGPPAPDDALFQDLLAAEWAVSTFYELGVKKFKQEDFTALGFPEDAYDRIQEIRNNEIGHVNMMINSISDTSVKPGPCAYNFNLSTPQSFLATQLMVEVTGTAFLSGLPSKAQSPTNQALLTSLTGVETRHGTWTLLDLWKDNPFAGPSDTLYPYPHQILALTTSLIRQEKCPKENPRFPSNPKDLRPIMQGKGKPGEEIMFTFPAPTPELQPKFEDGKEYFAVFFHALSNITCAFDVETRRSRVPAEFDKNKGIIVAVISDEPGATMKEESVVAGPALLLQQPVKYLEAMGG